MTNSTKCIFNRCNSRLNQNKVSHYKKKKRGSTFPITLGITNANEKRCVPEGKTNTGAFLSILGAKISTVCSPKGFSAVNRVPRAPIPKLKHYKLSVPLTYFFFWLSFFLSFFVSYLQANM